MKKTLLILTAAAGMLLLGGVSAKADDATTETTLELKVSEGTFDNQGGGFHKTWTSNSYPVITITAGNSANDMCADSSDNNDYSEGFELHEGSAYSEEDYIVSVESGYVITGMNFKVVTAATDGMIPTVTLGNQEVTASSTPQDMSISGLEVSSVSINLSSTSNNGYATLYDWTITVQVDPSKMLEALIEEAQAAYDANEIYDTDIDFGFSTGNGVGNGIIHDTKQFSSPYTESSEGSLEKLLDNDASTFWHSAWSDGSGNSISVENGVHYIEVDLSETYLKDDSVFVGGPMLVNILRRSGADNDHVTKMSVKSVASGVETKIATLDLPFGSAGERVVAGFTCPTDVDTLRFYEESTSSNRGYFHLGDFQLFYTTNDGPNNGLKEAEALAEAIATAQATLYTALKGSGSVSAEAIAALQEALDAYNAYFDAIAELNNGLLEAIEQAYDAYEANCGYEDLVLESAGDNLITSADQLSSPYSETEGALGNLIDNDISTHWDSKWSSGSVDNGVHYIQVELPDEFEGGEIQVYIERRNDTYNNHITEMSVKGIVSDEYGREAAYRIALLDLPYAFHYDTGEEEYAGFTCPAGVKTLRFYEEATAGQDQYNAGFWHLAEFHLYASSLTDDCGNTTLKKDKKAALLTAINTALGKYGNCTEEDIETLEEAISTYLKEEISWTLGASYGTLILPFNDDVDASGLTVYPCTGVNDNVVELDEAVNAIAPKTPYIVSGTASTTTPITFSGEASFKTSLYSDTQGLLTGTLTGTTAPTNSYVLQLHDGKEEPAFYLVDSTDITVGAYHCYLTLTDTGGDAKAVVYFPNSGVATAIEAVETAAEAGNGAVYDLSGRKVTNPRSGIYIKGGKKVIIK